MLECIVNALIHRNYLDLGSEVHIDLYDDRLEVYSPGGMVDGSIVQNLDTDRVPSRRRNPIIADIFHRMNYMERRGSGFKKIKGDYHKEINYKSDLEPIFYSDNNSFWVTLYNLNYDVPIDKVDIDDNNVDIGDKKVDIVSENVDIRFFDNKLACMNVNIPTKKKIKNLHQKFESYTVFSRKDVVALLNISPTSASVLISKMDKAGLLEAVIGQGKGKYTFR